MKTLSKWFLTSMAICNECLIEIDKDNNINYTSPSPDEIALCKAAKQFGLELRSRQGTIALLNDFGQEVTIDVKMVNTFFI